MFLEERGCVKRSPQAKALCDDPQPPPTPLRLSGTAPLPARAGRGARCGRGPVFKSLFFMIIIFFPLLLLNDVILRCWTPARWLWTASLMQQAGTAVLPTTSRGVRVPQKWDSRPSLHPDELILKNVFRINCTSEIPPPPPKKTLSLFLETRVAGDQGGAGDGTGRGALVV